MKKIFILFAVAFIGFASCVESKQVMTVTVTNPLGLERAGEMIDCLLYTSPSPRD